MKKYQGLRILERVAQNDQFAQPEYTLATPECPQSELWRMLDSQNDRDRSPRFFKTLVTTVKRKVIVETGTSLVTGP
jgi:hypothetical protein